MNHSQNPNKKKERQTNIISDADALAMAEAQAPGGRKGAGKKGKFDISKAQNAGISKPKAKPAPQNSLAPKANLGSKSASVPQFYEEDGLRIPLYSDKGKKHTNARSGTALGHKLSKKVLLGMVQDYAGDAKVKEFEKAKTTCHDLGMWIEEVETKAWGSGPMGKGTAPAQKQPAPEPAPTKAQPKAKALVKKAHAESDQNILSQAHGLGKRKHDEEVTTTPNTQTNKKAPPTPCANTQPHQNQDQRKIPQPPTSPQPQAAEEDMAPKRKTGPQEHKKPSADPAPKKQAAVSPVGISNVPRNASPLSQFTGISKTKEEKLAVVSRGNNLYIPKMNVLGKDEQHPFINALGIGPSDTRILDLPAEKAHAIITAESDTAVHITEIPYKDTRRRLGQGQLSIKSKQPQEAAPYLKPGRHGYDFANNRWHLASYRDLLTGIGHQVEPADATAYESNLRCVGEQAKSISPIHQKIEKLNVEMGLLSEELEDPVLGKLKLLKQKHEGQLEIETAKLKELETERERFHRYYREKYSGTLASQWPCGCEKAGAETGAWKEDDSEEE